MARGVLVDGDAAAPGGVVRTGIMRGDETLEERKQIFLSRISFEQRPGCWMWTWSLNSTGYGKFNPRPGFVTEAHRAAWELFIGSIPDKMQVLHKCDEGLSKGDISYRRCVNPAHLYLGTQEENMRDASAKGRLSTGDEHRVALRNRNFRYDAEHARKTKIGSPRGERAPNARFTDKNVHEIRYGKYSEWSQYRLAELFLCSQATISNIRTRKTWGHLP